MSLNLSLQAGSAPAETRLPGNAQALLDFIAAYMLIAGGQNFNGINFGSVTPSADNRDKPWWRTDSSGNPIGMFSWNGTAWATVAFIPPNGPSAGRPLNPAAYTEYFDTTINCLLIFERGQWRTESGSPGDVKYVKAVTIDQAILQNPGWIQDNDSIARVIGGAGTAAGVGTHGYLDKVGAENITLGINQLPAHTHDMTYGNANADGNDANIDQGLMWHSTPGTAGENTRSSTSVGSGENVPTQPPTAYYWCLVKQ